MLREATVGRREELVGARVGKLRFGWSLLFGSGVLGYLPEETAF